jgi:hypothetical protein
MHAAAQLHTRRRTTQTRRRTESDVLSSALAEDLVHEGRRRRALAHVTHALHRQDRPHRPRSQHHGRRRRPQRAREVAGHFQRQHAIMEPLASVYHRQAR